MSWFRRRIDRWRNLMADSDYAGSHGGGSNSGGGSAPSQSTQSTSYREAAITEVRTRGSVGPGG